MHNEDRTYLPVEGHWYTSDKQLTGCPHRIFQVVSSGEGCVVIRCGSCVARETIEVQSYAWLRRAHSTDFFVAIDQLKLDKLAIEQTITELENAMLSAPS